MTPTRPPLLPLDDAMARLLAHARPLAETESVSTFDADGRVLAQDVVSQLQVPPQDNSSMDGYAVALRRSAAAARCAVLVVSQRIPAGASGQALQPGQAARIFTGAPIPPGADAVVMQEDCELVPAPEADAFAAVKIAGAVAPGQWIRRSGEDVTRGSVVLARVRGCRRPVWAWPPASAWTDCRSCAVRALRCSRPVTNW